MTPQQSRPGNSTSRPLRVVVGVGGGIAAFKAAHLIRYFTEAGHHVTVIPTQSALRFIGAATFEALSGNPVTSDVFTGVDTVQHVRLGQEADLVVIAPATADLVARLAQGRADDLLTGTCLVATCPIVLAPAMHTEMWLNAATQDNVATLRRRGFAVLDPAHGRLTGADTGPGRLPDPTHIGELAVAVYSQWVRDEARSTPTAPGAAPKNPHRTEDTELSQEVAASAETASSSGSPLPARAGAGRPADRRAWLLRRSWEGRRVLISAGGTHEPLDPVRFLGNASSGRQGFALADIATQRGADVTIVAGVTEDLPTPSGARVVRVRTAQEMHGAMLERADDADVIIMAAAVADYRPETASGTKIKKTAGSRELVLPLVENPDILRALVDRRAQAAGGPGSGAPERNPLIVGFAAETGDETASPLDHALAKLERKGCDMLVCNPVDSGKVFGQPDNAGWILLAGAEGGPAEVETVEPARKHLVAAQVLDTVERLLHHPQA